MDGHLLVSLLAVHQLLSFRDNWFKYSVKQEGGESEMNRASGGGERDKGFCHLSANTNPTCSGQKPKHIQSLKLLPSGSWMRSSRIPLNHQQNKHSCNSSLFQDTLVTKEKGAWGKGTLLIPLLAKSNLGLYTWQKPLNPSGMESSK